jgi:beta-glucosidase
LHRDDRTSKNYGGFENNQSDIIVAALGESAEMSGESSSRTKYPSASSKGFVTKLLKTGKPVVLVLFTGRPLVLVQENETVQLF